MRGDSRADSDVEGGKLRMMRKVVFFRPEGALKRTKEVVERYCCEFFGFSVFELRTCEGACDEIAEFLRDGAPDFVIFTSENGVKHAFKTCAGRIDLRLALSSAKICAIGPATMRELRRHGFDHVLMPDGDYSSRGLMRMLSEITEGKRVLLLRSSAGSGNLSNFLREKGAYVRDIAVYEPILMKTPEKKMELQSLIAFKPDFVVFTSSLTFKSLMELADAFDMRKDVEDVLKSSKIIAIGNPTAETIASHGLNAVVAPKSTVEDVMKIIVESRCRG